MKLIKAPTYSDFGALCQDLEKSLVHYHQLSNSPDWQGMDRESNNIPRLAGIYHVAFMLLLSELETPGQAAKIIKPNLPWADVHFEERISGIPLNPGESYKQWPFYGRDTAVRSGGIFSHTYMERIWPKHARMSGCHDLVPPFTMNTGIRYSYGDLNSVIKLLANNPETRQAYLPIWFPEDTGAESGQRVPCTLGYHFSIRNGIIDITYYIRSCDYLRHFRDDVYLAVRLLGYVIQQLNIISQKKYPMGYLSMSIVNLHIFETEVALLSKKIHK